ncbi:hypothetical protein NW755_010121 [Fusarium falciforme]|uniref:Transcription factor domain-containing protein n=1 Tax=Fusarium falciforme TaxID=195108 RepID=A0A9W8UWX8_9HYPO|nr:hypothetical protein NW755_010121 [Fusarium falciforme]
MPNIADPNRKQVAIENIVQSPAQHTPTGPDASAVTTQSTESDASSTGIKSQSEEPQASLVKDVSGHEHYIGPSGTLNFWNQLRKLVDANNSPHESPGREGSTKFTQDNTSRLLEADGQDDDTTGQQGAVEAAPQDGLSPGSITSAIARDFTRLPTADMNEILRQLPSNDVLEQLIQSYFKNVHDDFPLFHRATFEDEYELYIVQARRHPQIGPSRRRPLPDWGWIGCLHMMIAFGSIADRTIQGVDHTALRRKSVTVARALLPQFISKCSLTNFLASSLGRPSGLQELDVEIVPPREGFVDGGIGTDAKLVSWSLKLQGILARTRLLHLGTTRVSSAPTLDEIMTALETWKSEISKAPGFDVPWVKSSGSGLTDNANAMDMEDLKVSLAWKTRAQLRAVLLLHVQFHYIAIVATRPLLLRDVALTRKSPTGSPAPSMPLHSAVCVKHACQLSYLIILLDHFDVINGLSGLDIFYAYCSAMVLILRLLRLRPGESTEDVGDEEASLQTRIGHLVSTLRGVISRTEKSGSMKRLAQVVDTFSECANNPNEAPSSPPLGSNINGVAHHASGIMNTSQSEFGQAMTLGSMEGLIDFLPFPGFGTIEGSMTQFMPGGDVTMPEWSDMELFMGGFGEQGRTAF